MRITELFTAQSIALDEALTDQEQIISRLVELQATHGNITDKDAYKKALYAREAEGSTYVDNGITVPHAKTNVVTRPSLAALRLSSPVQYNAEDDGTTDLLFAIAAPENGSLHVDMLARMGMRTRRMKMRILKQMEAKAWMKMRILRRMETKAQMKMWMWQTQKIQKL